MKIQICPNFIKHSQIFFLYKINSFFFAFFWSWCFDTGIYSFLLFISCLWLSYFLFFTLNSHRLASEKPEFNLNFYQSCRQQKSSFMLEKVKFLTRTASLILRFNMYGNMFFISMSQTKYCLSKKSWPISYCKLLYKFGQDFLDIQYDT